MQFYSKIPTIEEYWRSIILFGRNTATYKYALAKSLLEIDNKSSSIKIEDLAMPFVENIVQNMEQFPKQSTSISSVFLDACKNYKEGIIDKSQMQDIAIKKGFVNVIDAFHNVNQNPIEKRFFNDDRNQSKGIILTDEFYNLLDNKNNLIEETSSRWNLVAGAWDLGISKNIVSVGYSETDGILYGYNQEKRIDITSSRGALNGYQKGHCFYCFDNISIKSKSDNLADVDHFFPHSLDLIPNVNGIWNLVLACKNCNRGENGKFDKIPTIKLLERLNKRNEFLISSHHPLRETLIQQTGEKSQQRIKFLQNCYNIANPKIRGEWQPIQVREDLF